MHHVPGSENAMVGVAQCYGESVPCSCCRWLCARLANIDPTHSSQAINAFSKSSIRQIAASLHFYGAFTNEERAAAGGVVEIPADVDEEFRPLNYTPVLRPRYGADPSREESAALLVAATRGDLWAWH